MKIPLRIRRGISRRKNPVEFQQNDKRIFLFAKYLKDFLDEETVNIFFLISSELMAGGIAEANLLKSLHLRFPPKQRNNLGSQKPMFLLHI